MTANNTTLAAAQSVAELLDEIAAKAKRIETLEAELQIKTSVVEELRHYTDELREQIASLDLREAA